MPRTKIKKEWFIKEAEFRSIVAAAFSVTIPANAVLDIGALPGVRHDEIVVSGKITQTPSSNYNRVLAANEIGLVSELVAEFNTRYPSEGMPNEVYVIKYIDPTTSDVYFKFIEDPNT